MKHSDEDITKRLGLESADEQTRQGALQMFYQTLDTRVALAVQDKLTDEQLAEFEKLKDAEDTAADELLKNAVPDYDALFNEEADKLLTEIDADAAGMSPDQ